MKRKSIQEQREIYTHETRMRAAVLVAEARLLGLEQIAVSSARVYLCRTKALCDTTGNYSLLAVFGPRPKTNEQLLDEVFGLLLMFFPFRPHENHRHQALRPPTKVVVPRKDDRHRLGLQRRRHR
jgi:hypothetical protein